MTLLEVVLAMTIFVGSLAVLSQLTWNGSRAAVQGRLQTQALLRAEATLAELAVGAIPLQASTAQAFPDDERWSWSVNLGQTQYPELIAVEVTVSHSGGSSLGNISQSLTRWMRDPAIFEAALLEQQSESSTSTTTTP